MLNLDESCLSLDGNAGRRGGRPSVTFFDPNLPRTGEATTKSSITTTFITGSTAAGEPVPPHFQFSSKATSFDRERIRRETVAHFHKVKGKHGQNEHGVFPTTVGVSTAKVVWTTKSLRHIH